MNNSPKPLKIKKVSELQNIKSIVNKGNAYLLLSEVFKEQNSGQSYNITINDFVDSLWQLDRFKNVETGMVDLTKNLETLTGQTNELSSQLSSLLNSHNSLKSEFDNHKALYTKTIQTINSSIQTLQSSDTELNNKVSSLELNEQTTQSDISSLKSANIMISSNIDSLKSRVSNLENAAPSKTDEEIKQLAQTVFNDNAELFSASSNNDYITLSNSINTSSDGKKYNTVTLTTSLGNVEQDIEGIMTLGEVKKMLKWQTL